MKENGHYSYRGIDGVVPPNRIVMWFIDRLSDVFIGELEVRGQDNLRRAKRLAQEKRKGLVFAGNHQSHADFPVFKRALESIGDFEDVGENTVAILGIRLYKNPLVRAASRVAPHIKVYPPTMLPRNAQEEQSARQLNIKAMRANREVLAKGMHILVFPQGGREPHEITVTPKPQISGFLEHGIVVPMGILADKILPKDKIIPVRESAQVIFGEPFDGQSLREMFINLPKEERRQAMVDYVMIQIARLLPQDYWGVHRDKVIETTHYQNFII